MASGEFEIGFRGIEANDRRAEVGGGSGYDAGSAAYIEHPMTRSHANKFEERRRKTTRPPSHVDLVCRRVAGHEDGHLILPSWFLTRGDPAATA